MPRLRFLALALTLVALHATIDAPQVFTQSPAAPTLTSATSDGILTLVQWTMLPDFRIRYRVEAGAQQLVFRSHL